MEYLAHLYGIDHRTEDAQVVATTDIASKSHVQSLVEELTDGSHARCQIEIRRGTMGNHHTAAFHQLQFLPIGPYTVCHHSWRLPEETVLVIGITIAGTFRFQRLHQSYLRLVL